MSLVARMGSFPIKGPRFETRTPFYESRRSHDSLGTMLPTRVFET